MTDAENDLIQAIRNFKDRPEKTHNVTCANCKKEIVNPTKPCPSCFPNPSVSIDGVPKDLLNNTYPGYDPDSTRRAIGDNS